MPLNDRSRLDFSRCFSISYNSYFPRLLLPNWVQDYYSACENYRLLTYSELTGKSDSPHHEATGTGETEVPF